MDINGIRTLVLLAAGALMAAAGAQQLQETAPGNANTNEAPATSERIERDLRTDPLFKGANIKVDLYRGLAIVHGSAPNEDMINVINDRLRRESGVRLVYNYMNSPQESNVNAPQNVAVTYQDFRRFADRGPMDSTFNLVGRVEQRLSAAAALSRFEFQVDGYQGLIILHGTVDDAALVPQAKDIAAHTPGVEAVLNYVGVTPTVSAFMAETVPAPVMTRDLVQPAPNTEEPAPIPTAVQEDCGCGE
ncbi:MAG TPA: BON domain-containing protein [Planctomycetota bacterium]|jgi:osmotically-inducible protein OsmY